MKILLFLLLSVVLLSTHSLPHSVAPAESHEESHLRGNDSTLGVHDSSSVVTVKDLGVSLSVQPRDGAYSVQVTKVRGTECNPICPVHIHRILSFGISTLCVT